eukprot:4581101-Pyramimonas_sp.AAC.2
MLKLGRLHSPGDGSGQDEDVCCCEIDAGEKLVAAGCEVRAKLALTTELTGGIVSLAYECVERTAASCYTMLLPGNLANTSASSAEKPSQRCAFPLVSERFNIKFDFNSKHHKTVESHLTRCFDAITHMGVSYNILSWKWSALQGEKCEAVQLYEYNEDDVNQRLFHPAHLRQSHLQKRYAPIVVNRKGTILAAADDNGEVKIINLEKHSLQKTLSRGGHANAWCAHVTDAEVLIFSVGAPCVQICSSVQFRPHQPWEGNECSVQHSERIHAVSSETRHTRHALAVVSGGLDSAMVHWDFNAGRIKNRWNMGMHAEP